MVYLGKNGFWTALAQVVSTLSAFGMSLIFANILPKEVYGNYKYILSIVSILGALSLSGMGAVVTQGVAQGSEGILKDAVRTSLRWGSIIVMVTLGLAFYYVHQGNTTLGFGMLIAAICVPIINTFGLYGSFLAGKKDFKRGVLYNIYSQLFGVAALVIVAILTKSVLAMVVVYFVSSAIGVLIPYWYVIRRFHINEKKDHTLIPYSKHLSVINLFGTLASQLDNILVFHFIGAINLAIYTFAKAIPEQLKGALKNLFGIVLPKYAVLSDHDLRTSIVKKTIQLTLLTAGGVLVYLLTAHFLFTHLFPKYLEAVFYSEIYAIGLVTIPGTSLFYLYFQVNKDTRTMYKLNILNAITTITFTIIFIYKLGLLGAVIENGLDWTIFFFANWYYFLKTRPTRAS